MSKQFFETSLSLDVKYSNTRQFHTDDLEM